ncbi:MAG: HAMP domain-containing protein [Clostridia bacterium]|nr:HAMP domain-containing protein [Clostridia bacterium]
MFTRIKNNIVFLYHNISRSILAKYLIVTTAIILISLIVLGSSMTFFVSDRWKEEKQSMLASNASVIANLVSQLSTVSHSAESTDETTEYLWSYNQSLPFYFYYTANNIGADIFMVDSNGALQICSENGGDADSREKTCRHSEHVFPASLIGAVMNSTTDYRTTGTMDGIYDEANYIVGVPIVAHDAESDTDVTVAVIFAATPADMVSNFRTDITKLITITLLVVLACAVGALYIMTRRLVNPLRQMAAAARAFGNGDFSVRVPVSSDDETGQLAIAFNNMAASLSASENMSRSFVANVSHELKTPMTTIAGFIDGILDGTIPASQQEKYLSIVSAETRRLSRIVRSMLVLSKMDSGEMVLNPVKFDLTNTIVTSLLSFEQQIEAKNLEIRGMDELDSVYVNGDPDLIHQVVYNLLENAVKFTNEGGYIEIGIDYRDRTHFVKIRNSGQGISQDDIMHIFERFYKSDKSRSQDKTGVGLGLYIVRSIVALHGGQISVSSKEGQYSEFEFSLPDRQK